MFLGRSPKSGLPLSQDVADPLLAFSYEGEQLPSKNHRKQAGERITGPSHEWARFIPVGMHACARWHARVLTLTAQVETICLCLSASAILFCPLFSKSAFPGRGTER